LEAIVPDHLPDAIRALGLRSSATWDDCLREMRRLVEYERRVRSAAGELDGVARRVGDLVEAATNDAGTTGLGF
jgi:hypothetical protein